MGLPLAQIVGFKLPLQRGPRGYFAMISGEDVVKQEVKTVVNTEQGERVMRPTFGVRLARLLFEPNDQVLRDQVAYEIETALRIWVPRVQFIGGSRILNETEFDKVAHVLRFPVFYKIRSTGKTDSVDGEVRLRR